MAQLEIAIAQRVTLGMEEPIARHQDFALLPQIHLKMVQTVTFTVLMVVLLGALLAFVSVLSVMLVLVVTTARWQTIALHRLIQQKMAQMVSFIASMEAILVVRQVRARALTVMMASGTSCEVADPCVASPDFGKDGSDGVFHCMNGVVGGVTGSCNCTCGLQWSKL